MLIKYYALNGAIHILDGVSDVTVTPGLVDVEKEPSIEGYDNLIFEGLIKSGDLARVVNFAQNGPKKLFVYGFAYICNDDGKTIHKVEVERPQSSIVED